MPFPRFVNARDRKPLKRSAYFVKIDGRKDILRIEEIDKILQRHSSYVLFWLEEEPEEIEREVKDPGVFSKKPWE